MRHFNNVVKHMFNSWWLQTNCSMRNLLSAKSCNFQIDIFRWSVYRRPVFFPFLNIDCICCWIIEKVNWKRGLVYVHVLYPALFLTVQENSLFNMQVFLLYAE